MTTFARGVSFIGVAVSLLILLSGIWAALALWFQSLRLHPVLHWLLPCAWLLFTMLALAFYWHSLQSHRAPMIYLLAFAVLMVWWVGLAPSRHRAWADDVARALHAEVNGDVVTLHNVRNFSWRSETDYDARWEDRQYDLRRLTSTDMALSYWMGPAIAHTLVSFGFDDGRYLTFSIEIRKEREEAFSAIGGMFKQFELSLVAADESDILRVRTNIRGEDVYLYRVDLAERDRRALFLAYVAQANELAGAPRFYSTFTANCTVIVYQMVKRIISGLPLDYRLLASGCLPEYLHGIGGLASDGEGIGVLRERGRITQRARAMPEGEDFSRYVRQGIPGMKDARRANGQGTAS